MNILELKHEWIDYINSCDEWEATYHAPCPFTRITFAEYVHLHGLVNKSNGGA